jgi:hypothetical protein
MGVLLRLNDFPSGATDMSITISGTITSDRRYVGDFFSATCDVELGQWRPDGSTRPLLTQTSFAVFRDPGGELLEYCKSPTDAFNRASALAETDARIRSAIDVNSDAPEVPGSWNVLTAVYAKARDAGSETLRYRLWIPGQACHFAFDTPADMASFVSEAQSALEQDETLTVPDENPARGATSKP